MNFTALLIAAASLLTFEDRVRTLSLEANGSTYKVTFKEKAAFYKASSEKALIECLERSARAAKPVTVKVDSKTREIKSCSKFANQSHS